MIPVLQRSVDIERPLAEVYAYVADMANYVQWFPHILQMRAIDTLPVGSVGKRYDEVARLPNGQEERVQVQVVAAQPQQLLAIEADLQPPLPRFDYRFEALSHTRTRFTWCCRARNTAWAVRPFLWGMRLVLGRRLGQALVSLKALLERPAEQTMQAWLLRRFGPPHEVLLLHPHLARPVPREGEVLVRVRAAGVNPIDALRCSGYGRTLLRLKGAATTPLMLGNDVAGTVAAVGPGVRGFVPGERVFGAKPHGAAGTFAPWVVVPATGLAHTPVGLSDEQAAALPYAFLTAWSALVREGGLTPAAAPGLRVFVQGGGSSVGLAAIQLATAWGAEVHARCGAASMARARAAGASATHDRHRAPPAALQGHFDRVLVCAEPDDEAALIALLKPHAGAMLVSVVHPTLALADTLGPVRGLLAARRERRRRGAAAAAQGRAYRWCVMSIEPQAVALMAALLQQGRLRAHVGLRFDAAQLPQALQAVAEGRAGGRAVLNFP